MLSARSRCDEPALDLLPLLAGDQPGDDVERPRPVDVLALGVDRERDAHREDLEVGHPLALAQFVDAEPVEQLPSDHGRPGEGCPRRPAARPRALTVPPPSTRKTRPCCRDVKSPGPRHVTTNRSREQSATQRRSCSRERRSGCEMPTRPYDRRATALGPTSDTVPIRTPTREAPMPHTVTHTRRDRRQPPRHRHDRRS